MNASSAFLALCSIVAPVKASFHPNILHSLFWLLFYTLNPLRRRWFFIFRLIKLALNVSILKAYICYLRVSVFSLDFLIIAKATMCAVIYLFCFNKTSFMTFSLTYCSLTFLKINYLSRRKVIFSLDSCSIWPFRLITACFFWIFIPFLIILFYISNSLKLSAIFRLRWMNTPFSSG